ncbi:hypothetical protein ACIBI9_39700 [Nonomuraea sp. NPDC050451]|uniref:hypothetical protein n=1 Tax=Nonomuraea sp. NPDC050451 TaxID=3364364 RepID=UPI0037BC56E4
MAGLPAPPHKGWPRSGHENPPQSWGGARQTHDGSNGFKSAFKGYLELGAGYVILANGSNMSLVNEIAAAVRSVYGWA